MSAYESPVLRSWPKVLRKDAFFLRTTGLLGRRGAGDEILKDIHGKRKPSLKWRMGGEMKNRELIYRLRLLAQVPAKRREGS
jgi:hypothetical protein